ncbi:MAG: CHASE2 domain-containing protein [Alphaproteobacteria bacterium]
MARLRRHLKNQLHLLLPLAILFAALIGWASEPAALEQLRLFVFDEFMRLKPRSYEPVPVRIVDIDDDSLARLGQWPWPRTLMAKLVDRLSELGAGVIAFDIVFAEPDRTSPAHALEDLKDLKPDDPLVARLAALPDHDVLLGEALKRAHTVTSFVMTHKKGALVPKAKASFANAGDDPRPWVPHFGGAIVNLGVFEDSAAGNGSTNDILGIDGVTRRVPLVLELDNRLYPALAAEVLRVAQGARTYVVKSTGASGVMSFGEHAGINSLKIGALVVPTDARGTVWIHFTPHVPERFVPAWQVLDQSVDPDLIKGNIVFIGTSAAGLKEFHATPLDPDAAGVEIHAQLTEQMLLGDSLKRPEWARGVELVYMLVTGIALLLLLPRVGARWTALLGLAAIASAVGGSWYAYAAQNLLIDPVFPSVVALLVYLSSSAVLFLRTETERRRVRSAFGRYLAPAVVEQLSRHPERLVLGGEMREMTLMFSDIRGFTGIAERFDAHGLTSFINRFLTPMTDVILAARGTIDKYMGDAIMAFWNAPLDDPAHAEHACRAALTMRTELVRLNETWRREAAAEGKSFSDVRTGIGLNTGTCCVGNLGSDQRFDYSCLGDDVNLASRLEGQSTSYGVDIVVGEKTAAEAEGLAFLELDLVRVKGKARPVHIFALLGDETVEATSAFAALKADHDAMLAAYRGRRWAEALDRLEACRAQAPETLQAFYTLYEERIAGFRSAPPPADWDGAFVALTK